MAADTFRRVREMLSPRDLLRRPSNLEVRRGIIAGEIHFAKADEHHDSHQREEHGALGTARLASQPRSTTNAMSTRMTIRFPNSVHLRVRSLSFSASLCPLSDLASHGKEVLKFARSAIVHLFGSSSAYTHPKGVTLL